MPIASSSAMCLSRATGSRPVHPAITAWSIASVSGVVVPWASMLKVRSYMDDALHPGREFEDAAVGSAGGSEHHPDRHFTLAMGGQRNRATIDHVDQATIAQAAQVRHRKRLVVGEIGDPRRRICRGRYDQGMIGLKPCIDTRDQ